MVLFAEFLIVYRYCTLRKKRQFKTSSRLLWIIKSSQLSKRVLHGTHSARQIIRCSILHKAFNGSSVRIPQLFFLKVDFSNINLKQFSCLQNIKVPKGGRYIEMVIVVDHTEVCFYVCIFCKALPGPLFFFKYFVLKKTNICIYFSTRIMEA